METRSQVLDVEYMLLVVMGMMMKRGVQSCLIMQHKSYIVEQPPMCPFKSYYHYTKVCKLV